MIGSAMVRSSRVYAWAGWPRAYTSRAFSSRACCHDQGGSELQASRCGLAAVLARPKESMEIAALGRLPRALTYLFGGWGHAGGTFGKRAQLIGTVHKPFGDEMD